MSNFWFYSSIISGIATVFSLANYYTYSGANLISSANAKKLIQQGKIDIIIDVRTNVEYNVGHYPNSLNIPVNAIDVKTTANLNKDSNILVYCNTGQRARVASDKLNTLGFKNVVYIPGSYLSIL